MHMTKMTPNQLLAEPGKTKPRPVGLRRMAVLALAGVLPSWVSPLRRARTLPLASSRRKPQ